MAARRAGPGDPTGALLRQVHEGGAQLLRACARLAEDLPGATMGAERLHGTEWPRVLGGFRGVSSQLAELQALLASSTVLAHTVPLPAEIPPRDPTTGELTVLPQELLRTKQPIEMERSEAELAKSVRKFLPRLRNADGPDDEAKAREEQEEQTVSRLADLNKVFVNTNRNLDSCILYVRESETRVRLKRKSQEMVRKTSAKRQNIMAKDGVEIFAAFYQGPTGFAKLRKNQAV